MSLISWGKWLATSKLLLVMLKLLLAAFTLGSCQTSELRDQWDKMPVHICLNSKAGCNSSVIVWLAFASRSCSSANGVNVNYKAKFKAVSFIKALLYYAPRKSMLLVQSPQMLYLESTPLDSKFHITGKSWSKSFIVRFFNPQLASLDKCQGLFRSSMSSWHWVATTIVGWSCFG